MRFNRFIILALIGWLLSTPGMTLAHYETPLDPVVSASAPITTHVYLPLLIKLTPSPDFTTHPNDPYYPTQWALTRTHASTAWNHARGAGILIAVLDTGADYQHPDLAGKLRTDLGWDWINKDAEAQDDHGHGTHVTGIAAAITNNERGVAGLGWEAEILPLKVLNHQNVGTLSDVASAIYYATDKGAHIINLSLGSDPKSALSCSQVPIVANAIQYAYEHNVLVLVASGSHGGDANKVVPANCPYVLTVGSTDSADNWASFSNYGEVVDITAPGVNIYSTSLNASYAHRTGTSMSTPLVAGLAALIWSRFPTYTADEVSLAIVGHALDLGVPGRDIYYGAGRINAANSVVYGANYNAPNPLLRSHEETEATAWNPAPHVPGRLVVGTTSLRQRIALAQAAGALGLTLQQALPQSTLVLTVPSGAEADVAQRLITQNLVEYVSLDYLVSGD